jgi:hypothetical protein
VKRNLRAALSVPVFLVLAANAAPAFAHAYLRDPPGRHPDDPLAIDQYPCGLADSARGSIVTTYTAGSTVTLEIEIAVAHGTRDYRLAIDDDGQEFPLPNDTAGVAALPFTLDFHLEGEGMTIMQEITIPSITCDNCTLQLMQQQSLSEAPSEPGEFYYQCADIVIEGGGSGASSGGTGGSDAAAGAGVGGSSNPGGSAGSGTLSGGSANSSGGSSSLSGGSTTTGMSSSDSDTEDAGGCAVGHSRPSRFGALLLLGLLAYSVTMRQRPWSKPAPYRM